jgi:hypothetical protein
MPALIITWPSMTGSATCGNNAVFVSVSNACPEPVFEMLAFNEKIARKKRQPFVSAPP